MSLMAMRAAWATQSLVMVLGPRVSPAITTWLVVARVSHATRSCQGSIPALGPSRKKRSTTSSEIRSQTLSGCPSETDSLVNKYDLRDTWHTPWLDILQNREGSCSVSVRGQDDGKVRRCRKLGVGHAPPELGCLPMPRYSVSVPASLARLRTSSTIA